MSENLEIRCATLEDCDVLVAFNFAMARETEGRELELDTLRAGVSALLADPDRGHYWVLQSEGQVLAALMLTREWSDWRNGEFWWIQSVYVRPEARRRGYYRRLYAHVQKLASLEPSVCGLRLYVEGGNIAAQRTYAALGMRETSYKVFELERD